MSKTQKTIAIAIAATPVVLTAVYAGSVVVRQRLLEKKLWKQATANRDNN
jgi:hypothetical protein